MVVPASGGQRIGTRAALVRRITWVSAIVTAVVFVIPEVSRLSIFTEASYRIFWPNRYWVLVHFLGGSIALFCGLPQFSARLRGRYPAVHRWTGRLYLTGVIIGVASAWYMSFYSAFGWTMGVATFVLGVAWVATTAMAYVAVRRHQFQAHREWMIRSYVVTFAFVFFRLMYASPLFAATGTMLERVTALLWLSFVVPLLITEIVLQWRRSIGTSRRAAQG
jgi:hypothetical protein